MNLKIKNAPYLALMEWEVEKGKYILRVGNSSRNNNQQISINIH